MKRILFYSGWLLFFLTWLIVGVRSFVHAQDVELRCVEMKEVKPYAFAALPYGGKIYKAVHEGCELFIVEGYQRVPAAPDYGGNYAIATGRGCR